MHVSLVFWSICARDCATVECPPSTNFDGVKDAAALVVGQAVSIRALYFGPPTGPTPTPTPFSAAKVRVP